ncbi:hypothetical protein [Thalassovita sp.]|uniref:hypothetical protein n=1 Tax=Thalassovita sp. TaxID=1979401 RepID=UPI002B26766F|nr:hypothetical protein [Thalassovita sp.]
MQGIEYRQGLISIQSGGVHFSDHMHQTARGRFETSKEAKLSSVIGLKFVTIFALFSGNTVVKRVGGDVAEWSKALPC